MARQRSLGYEGRVSFAISSDAEGSAEEVLASWATNAFVRRVRTASRTAAIRRSHLAGGLLARALLALIVVASIASCWGGGGPGAAYYVDLLESLELPAAWELAHTRQREGMSGPDPCGPGDFSCPSAHRYYYVSGEPAAAYPDVRQLLLDSGFEISREYYPDCDGTSRLGIPCQIDAARGADVITVHLYDPGRDVEELGIGRPGVFVVELLGYYDERTQKVGGP